MSINNTGAQLDGGESGIFETEIRFGPECLVYIDSQTGSDQLLGVDADGDIRFTTIDPVDNTFISNDTGTESIYCRSNDLFVTGTMNIRDGEPFVVDGDVGVAGEFLQVAANGKMYWGPNSGNPNKIISPNLLTYVEVLDSGVINLVGTPHFTGTTPWTLNSVIGTSQQVISVDAGGSLVWRDLSDTELDYVAGTNINIDSATRTISTKDDVVFNDVELSLLDFTATGQIDLTLGGIGLAGNLLGKTAANELTWVNPSTGLNAIPVSGQNIAVLPNNPVPGDYKIDLFTNITSGLNLLHATTQISSAAGLFSTLRCDVSARIRDTNLATINGVGPRFFINGLPGAAVKNILVGLPTGEIGWEPLGTPTTPDLVSTVSFAASSPPYNSTAIWPTGTEHVILGPASQSVSYPAAFYLLPSGATTNFSGSVRFESTMFAATSPTNHLIFGVPASSSTILRGHIFIHSRIIAQSASSPYSVVNPITAVIPIRTSDAIKSIRVTSSGGAYGYFPAGDMTMNVTYVTQNIIDLDITLYTTNSPNTLLNYLAGGALSQTGLA